MSKLTRNFLENIQDTLKNIKVLIAFIAFIFGMLAGIIWYVQEQNAIAMRTYKFSPEYLLDKVNSPIEMLLTQNQVDAVFRSTNI